MSLHQLSGRIRWRIWAGGRGWIWRIRAAVGIGRSRSCRCWSTDVVRLEGEGNDRLLPSFKQTPAFYSIYDAPSFLSLFFFFSSFHPQKSGGRETKRPILSSPFRIIFVTTIPFSLFILSFRDIDNPEGVKITGIHLFRINGDWLLIKLGTNGSNSLDPKMGRIENYSRRGNFNTRRSMHVKSLLNN